MVPNTCGCILNFLWFSVKDCGNPPSYFQLFDNLVLLAALYAVTTATAMFIMPVVHHMMHYRKFDVEKYLLTTKKYTLIGIICVMLHVLRSRVIIEFQIAD